MAKPVKVANLRRFVKQWNEYRDEETEMPDPRDFGGEDISYVTNSLYGESGMLDKYNRMAMEAN